jgi:hypothetical protein
MGFAEKFGPHKSPSGHTDREPIDLSNIIRDDIININSMLKSPWRYMHGHDLFIEKLIGAYKKMIDVRDYNRSDYLIGPQIRQSAIEMIETLKTAFQAEHPNKYQKVDFWHVREDPTSAVDTTYALLAAEQRRARD